MDLRKQVTRGRVRVCSFARFPWASVSAGLPHLLGALFDDGGWVLRGAGDGPGFPALRLAFQRPARHLPILRSLSPPHLPQAQRAGPTTRSKGRCSGQLRGPRGVRSGRAAADVAISAWTCCAAWVSFRSSMARSSCSNNSLPRSKDWQNCCRRPLAASSFNYPMSYSDQPATSCLVLDARTL